MTNDSSENPTAGEWFNPPTPLLNKAALVAAAKLAAGVQNLSGNRCAEGFGILMYHRVAERIPGIEKPSINVTPARFRRQLAGLLARGFEAWPLSKLVTAQRESRQIPGTAFAVTFDDGFENNYSLAWPILRELNVPATIFLATKYLDCEQPFPFDAWNAAGTSHVARDAWRPLATRQCDEMLADGLIELGAHTHSHERFLGRREEFDRDLRLCLDVLRDRFGLDRPTFAFPYGDMSPELVDVARQLGVTCCASTIPRRVAAGENVYELGRFYVGESDTPSMLAAKLSGWYPALVVGVEKLMQPLSAAVRGPRHPAVSGRQKRLSGDSRLARKAPSQP